MGLLANLCAAFLRGQVPQQLLVAVAAQPFRTSCQAARQFTASANTMDTSLVLQRLKSTSVPCPSLGLVSSLAIQQALQCTPTPNLLLSENNYKSSAEAEWLAIKTAPHSSSERGSLCIQASSHITRGFASDAATEEVQAAQINPLLQTPAPVRREEKAAKRAASGANAGSSRERDPKTAAAILRDIQIAPKKLAMWTDLIRRRHLDDAVLQCEMSPKKAARICLKVRMTFLFQHRQSESLTLLHLLACVSPLCAAPHVICIFFTSAMLAFDVALMFVASRLIMYH